MSAAAVEVELAATRLAKEEGDERLAYNDATGEHVTCRPEGNLSIGTGINLEIGLDEEEGAWLLRHRLGKVASALTGYLWYMSCNAVRRSVLLDIAYNAGVDGLLKFKNMIAAITREDWGAARHECMVQNPELKGRYTLLGNLLYGG